MDRKPRHIPHSNFGFLGNLANELFEDSFDSPQPLTSFDGFVQIDGDPGIPLEIAMPFQTHPSNNAHGSHDSFLKECEEGCVYFSGDFDEVTASALQDGSSLSDSAITPVQHILPSANPSSVDHAIQAFTQDGLRTNSEPQASTVSPMASLTSASDRDLRAGIHFNFPEGSARLSAAIDGDHEVGTQVMPSFSDAHGQRTGPAIFKSAIGTVRVVPNPDSSSQENIAHAVETATVPMVDNGRVMKNGKTYKIKLVNRTTVTLTSLDVIAGRGKFANEWPGNRMLRRQIKKRMNEYHNSTIPTKTEIARTIVKEVVQDGGKFWKYLGTQQAWKEMTEKGAHDRVTQAFRTPKMTCAQKRALYPNAQAKTSLKKKTEKEAETQGFSSLEQYMEFLGCQDFEEYFEIYMIFKTA